MPAFLARWPSWFDLVAIVVFFPCYYFWAAMLGVHLWEARIERVLVPRPVLYVMLVVSAVAGFVCLHGTWR